MPSLNSATAFVSRTVKISPIGPGVPASRITSGAAWCCSSVQCSAADPYQATSVINIYYLGCTILPVDNGEVQLSRARTWTVMLCTVYSGVRRWRYPLTCEVQRQQQPLGPPGRALLPEYLGRVLPPHAQPGHGLALYLALALSSTV